MALLTRLRRRWSIRFGGEVFQRTQQVALFFSVALRFTRIYHTNIWKHYKHEPGTIELR
jgi:hypothetical protein